MMKENILEIYCCNEFNIGKYIKKICIIYNRSLFNLDIWINLLYMLILIIIEVV